MRSLTGQEEERLLLANDAFTRCLESCMVLMLAKKPDKGYLEKSPFEFRDMASSQTTTIGKANCLQSTLSFYLKLLSHPEKLRITLIHF